MASDMCVHYFFCALFHRVIPTRFREIRVRLRHEMISTILDNRHISEHTDRHLSAMVSSTDVPRKIATFMANPEVATVDVIVKSIDTELQLL